MFAYVTDFYTTVQVVVTYCLNGWCMLGVFLLLAITHPGNECQNTLSLCDGIRVHIGNILVKTSIQKSCTGSEPMLLPREKFPQQEGSEKGQSCIAASCRIVSLTHYQPPLYMFI